MKKTIERLDSFREWHDDIDAAINFLVSLVSVEPRIDMPEVDSTWEIEDIVFTWNNFVIYMSKPKLYYLNGLSIPEPKSLKEIICLIVSSEPHR